jgi:hypothetical protein
MKVFIEGLESNRFVQRNACAINSVVCSVQSTSVIKRKPWVGLCHRAIIIVNWSENRLIKSDGELSVLGFVGLLLRWSIYRCLGFRLIWIRHNRWPHASKVSARPVLLLCQSVLAKVVNKQACLSYYWSNKLGLHYIPFIAYSDTSSSLSASRRNVAVMLGKMQPYKQYERILDDWNANLSLEVIGPIDKEYKLVLERCVEKKEREGSSILLKDYRLSDNDYDNALLTSRYAVISYSIDSAYVSAAIHHALSFGCIPIMPKSDYREELENQGIPILSLENLDLNARYSEEDFDIYFDCFGQKAVAESWSELFRLAL